MPDISIYEGQLVYVRAYSTQRAAIAEVLALVHGADRDWGQVRLVTEWYDWDRVPTVVGPTPGVGEVLQVEAYRLEAIHW